MTHDQTEAADGDDIALTGQDRTRRSTRMSFMKGALNRQTLSWAFYDWANSAFATTIMAGFFPIFFKQYWSAGADVTLSTFRLGLANSAASLLIAIIAPLLGAIADRS